MIVLKLILTFQRAMILLVKKERKVKQNTPQQRICYHLQANQQKQYRKTLKQYYENNSQYQRLDFYMSVFFTIIVLLQKQQINSILNMIYTYYLGLIVFLQSGIRIYNQSQKKMSITISNCEQICSDPSNKSKAKMLYTFSKASRFPKRKIILCDKFYEHSSSVSPKRTTTFGYGKKYDFMKDVPNTPPPTSYNLKTQFEKTIKKGFGFGQGREQMQVTGPLVDTIHNKNPGPGTYELKSTLSPQGYSLGSRNFKDDKQKAKLPGPGSYPTCFTINKDGSYFFSKFRNSLARNFSQLPRAATAPKISPGPGKYDLSRELMASDGTYIISKIHNSYVRSFGNSLRSKLNQKNNNPGPGNYKLPSQFGHYISKSALKQEQQKKITNKQENKENQK